MARPLHFSPPPLSTTSQTILSTVSILLCVFVLFACASHSRRSRRWRACYEFLELEDEHVIELNNEVMLQNTEFQEYQLGNGDQSSFSSEQQEVSIWQKNILMGGKCQLPDFSGVIIYDSNGTIVTPTKPQHPLLTWK